MKPFQPDKTLRKSRGNLPHWTQENSTYFITFRLVDSIPKAAMNEWSDQRSDWIRCQGMDPSNFKSTDLAEDAQKEYARRFGKKFHDLLDSGYGSCLLKLESNRLIISDSLFFFDQKRYKLSSFVTMPNHVHLLITPLPSYSLTKVLQSLKSYTAKKINQNQSTSGPIWQRESYDRIVRNRREFDLFTKYIQENPTKANLSPQEYTLYP